MSSILEESRRAKHKGWLGIFKNKKIAIPILALMVIGAGIYFYTRGNKPLPPKSGRLEEIIFRPRSRPTARSLRAKGSNYPSRLAGTASKSKMYT